MTEFADRYGPWAVIAGGSEGVGEAFARQLADRGLNLVLLARKAGPLEATAARLRAGTSATVRTLLVDLTDEFMLDAIKAVTDDIEVGTLIYTAGAAGGPVALIDQPVADALSSIRLNVVGQTLLARHFGTAMARRGRGMMFKVPAVVLPVP